MKKEYKKQIIHWDDAYHLADSWLDWETIKAKYNEGGYETSNIGWVIYEDKKYVILACKHDKQKRDFGQIMMIPKGIITKRINLKEK